MSIKNFFLFRAITYIVLAAFVSMLPVAPSHAQVVMLMPPVGQMIHVTRHFEPPQMIGLKVDLKDPFSFNFIMDQGQKPMPDEAKKEEFNKIIKYFLVSLAMPNKDMWVNLSPYESQRIIPRVFAQTEMGRDLLAQDYVLKQLTASLIYPEEDPGKKFWAKIYKEAQERFGTTAVNVNTFNKVWIMADKADIYQKGTTAFLVKSHLKVMLEEDYMAIEKNKDIFGSARQRTDVHKDTSTTMASQIVRQIIIPALEKEVNEGASFATVRQAYGAEILATWFKKTLRESLLGQVFADKSKIEGQRVQDPKAMEKIYRQYLRAYKKGVFNYIKEDMTPDGQMIPRKYFSGGVQSVDGAMLTTITPQKMASSPAMRAEVKDFAQSFSGRSRGVVVAVTLLLATLAGGLGIARAEPQGNKKGLVAGEGRLAEGNLDKLMENYGKGPNGVESIGEPNAHSSMFKKVKPKKVAVGERKLQSQGRSPDRRGTPRKAGVDTQPLPKVEKIIDPYPIVRGSEGSKFVAPVFREPKRNLLLEGIALGIAALGTMVALVSLALLMKLSRREKKGAAQKALEKSLMSLDQQKTEGTYQKGEGIEEAALSFLEQHHGQIDKVNDLEKAALLFLEQHRGPVDEVFEMDDLGMEEEDEGKTSQSGAINADERESVGATGNGNGKGQNPDEWKDFRLDVQMNARNLRDAKESFEEARNARHNAWLATTKGQIVGMIGESALERLIKGGVVYLAEWVVFEKNPSYKKWSVLPTKMVAKQAIGNLRNRDAIVKALLDRHIIKEFSEDFVIVEPFNFSKEDVRSAVEEKKKTDPEGTKGANPDEIWDALQGGTVTVLSERVSGDLMPPLTLKRKLQKAQDAYDALLMARKALDSARGHLYDLFKDTHTQMGTLPPSMEKLVEGLVTNITDPLFLLPLPLSLQSLWKGADQVFPGMVLWPKIGPQLNARDPAMHANPLGGINLSDEHLVLNIKVDGAGMPLPAAFQDKAMIHLNGLTSIIRKITPITPQNFPELYELVR